MKKTHPEGPSSKGLKNHTLDGIWDQSPEIFGTWTLWAGQHGDVRA